MYLEDKIDEEDFRRIKMKYKAEIENITFKLNSLKNSVQTSDVEHKMKQALNAIIKISERYKNASTIDKRAIVGLIYPEKLIFDGEYFQTTKINSLAGNIALINKELGNKKPTKKRKNFKCRSCDFDRIQTCNLLSRNQVRYSVAPRSRCLKVCKYNTFLLSLKDESKFFTVNRIFISNQL